MCSTSRLACALYQDWHVLCSRLAGALSKICMCSTQDWHVLYLWLAYALLKIGMCFTSRLACALYQDWHVLHSRLACALHKIGMCSNKIGMYSIFSIVKHLKVSQIMLPYVLMTIHFLINIFLYTIIPIGLSGLCQTKGKLPTKFYLNWSSIYQYSKFQLNWLSSFGEGG